MCNERKDVNKETVIDNSWDVSTSISLFTSFLLTVDNENQLFSVNWNLK